MSTKENRKEQKTAGGPKDQMTIQERIKELRCKNRLTQEGAALKFHTNKSTWSRIESGERAPSLQLVEQICQEWHVSADYLLFGEKDTENQVDLSGLSFSQIHIVKELVNDLRCS